MSAAQLRLPVGAERQGGMAASHGMLPEMAEIFTLAGQIAAE
jgi:hypothetical protein